ncbi:Short-chain dehydrogenase/reductase ATR9 [Psilocybe cubensis]|uniref:Short-chain dehydrogenase/reductase ATR9 n=2 Tax=Psilocybe cubensis TaxID=181762 RepID=A0ACB8GT01_PSICU|nr:Short-chain dehydrogenase/reductase ATR9 [Psilocybe cubensis]KAH9478361.1 Short-chain dehydrogenase/reductase ATR9 [Psilocybe cubensis]
MATLQGKSIVVVGGSSGIGFAVALASLQSQAKSVIIASSNQAKVERGVERLKAYNLPGEISGHVVDAMDSASVKKFALDIGTVDHIVWSSGDNPGKTVNAKVETYEAGQGVFAVRFWGPFVLAQHAKFNPGGSLTLTSGLIGVKPWPGSHLAAGMLSSLDGLVRGLAVDLAPVRVNLVNPGPIDTEIFDIMFGDQKKSALEGLAAKSLLKRVGEPSEAAEAYLFLMKCGFITGQRIDVEGGQVLM